MDCLCVDGWINSSKVSGREEEDHKNGHHDSQTCGPWTSFLWVYTKGLLYSKKIRDLDHLQRWITAACIAAISTMLKRMWQHWATGLQVGFNHNSEHVENSLSSGLFPPCSR